MFWYLSRTSLKTKSIESVIGAAIRISIHPEPVTLQSSCLQKLIPNPLILQLSRHLQQEAPDYYGILGVTKNAELAEIKLAYFNMAKKFHPDTNKTLDARQVFALIAEAYDVLSDEARRARYDETGLGEERFGGRAYGPSRQSTDTTYTSEQMYEKIFGNFGSGPAGGATEDGDNDGEVHQDYAETFSGQEATKEYIAKISFNDAFLGTTLNIQYRYVGVCNKCNGTRSELGYTGNICPYCEGTGEETVKTGNMTARTQCSYCEGTKIFIKFKCLECEGMGRKTFDNPIQVDIPPGTLHGEVFRVDLDTENLMMAENSHKVLWVTVSVEESKEYTMDDRDLVTRAEISPAMAVLGGTTLVQTPARLVPVSVPAGSASDKVVVVADEGLRPRDSMPGDLRVYTAIRVPTKLTWRQRRVLRKFAALEPSVADKLVDSIDHDTDHKLLVNVVEADRILNNVVKPEKIDPMQRTITQTIRDTLGIKSIPQQQKPAYPYHYHRIFRFG